MAGIPAPIKPKRYGIVLQCPGTKMYMYQQDGQAYFTSEKENAHTWSSAVQPRRLLKVLVAAGFQKRFPDYSIDVEVIG